MTFFLVKVTSSLCLSVSKEKGDVSFSTSGLLKWQVTTFFFQSAFTLYTLSTRKTIDCVPGFLILIENVFTYSQKLTIKVSLSLFVNKNVRTHSTTVVNCFFRVAHREQYREENTSSIALNLASIKIKVVLHAVCSTIPVWPVRSRIARY